MTRLPYILILCLLGVIGALWHRNRRMDKDLTIYSYELEDVRLSNGDLAKQNTIMSVESERAFLKVRTNDSIIDDLQSKLTRYKDEKKDAFISVTHTVDIDTFFALVRDTVYKEVRVDKHVLKYFFDGDDFKFKLKTTSSINLIQNQNKIIGVSDGGTVTNVQAIKFEKPKKFSIGLQVGYGITGNQITPYIGVGVSYSILKF